LRAPATIKNVPPSPEEAAVVFLLRESEDLSQGTDNNDLAVATFLAGVNFDPINKRADDFNGLRASLLVIQ